MAVREIDCNGPGMRRRRAGKGFTYLDEGGERITDDEVVGRIRSLAIPPAWDDVWICSDPNGHIQATGLDAKGRRQYRYHDEWRAARDREKHDRVLRFAERLPVLREQVTADLALEGMPRERVLACAVRLLELGFFRVGGEVYAEENDSYGLATIRKDHVRVRADTLEFDYEAKSGQQRLCQVVDPDVRAVIVTLRRRRSPASAELLAYKDGREWIDVKSSDINEYIQAHIGDDFTAKDFRTWVGTVLAAAMLAVHDTPETPTEAKRVVAAVVRDVAEHLGNTPAVARSAYIDPRVVERFEKDDTVVDALADVEVEELEQGIPEDLEAAVLDLIDRARRRRAKGRRAPRRSTAARG
ncbi:MAG: DNA topoisomerase IB [Acidimicrobiales bacterium]